MKEKKKTAINVAAFLVLIAVVVTSYADIRKRQFVRTSDVECEIKMLGHCIDDLYLQIDSIKQIQTTINQK